MLPGGQDFVALTDRVVADPVADVTVLPADPDRVIVAVSTANMPSSTVTLEFRGGKNVFRIVLAKNTLTLITWKDHGPLVTYELVMPADATASAVYVYWARYRGE